MIAKIPKLKDPTTYNQQVDLLRTRGLTISDTSAAITILKHVNYYRLSAYTLTLKKDDQFYDGTTIDTVYNLYEFDRKLRNLLMGALEGIEVAFRTHIAYVLAHKYGSSGYLNSNNFSNAQYHHQFISTLTKEIGRADELFVKHHKEKYANQFPIWVATELLSFGALSKLFNNLKNEDKQQISKEYYGIPHPYISSWLRVLTIARNICAHYGRIYNI